MENIQLALTVDEANAILNVMGQQPYIKVADLIQKIQSQAASQLENSKTTDLPKKSKEVKTPIPAKDGK